MAARGAGCGSRGWLAAVSAGRFRLAAGLADHPNGFSSPRVTHPAASHIPTPRRMGPTSLSRSHRAFSLGAITSTASPAHTAGTYSIYIPIAVYKGTLELSPPHQYLWQARTPAQRCRGRCGAELGAAHHALLAEQTKAPPEPPRCLPVPPHRPSHRLWGRSQPVHKLISTPAALAGMCKACAGANDGGGRGCAGSGCPGLIPTRGQDGTLRHPLPAESLRGVTPTLISPAGESLAGQGQD